MYVYIYIYIHIRRTSSPPARGWPRPGRSSPCAPRRSSTRPSAGRAGAWRAARRRPRARARSRPRSRRARRAAGRASPRRGSSRFIKGGVQWKQGVVIYMMLYTSLLHNTTPIHCAPLRLHPPVVNTQVGGLSPWPQTRSIPTPGGRVMWSPPSAEGITTITNKI